MVGGVAGGIGERFDVDANIVRVVFVVLTFLYGLGAAIYLAMWVLIPQSGRVRRRRVIRVTRPPRQTCKLLRYVLLAGVVVAAVIVLGDVWRRATSGRTVSVCPLAGLSGRPRGPVPSIIGAPAHAARRFIALVFLSVLTVFDPALRRFLGFLASTGVPMTGGSGARVVQPNTWAKCSAPTATEFGTMTVDLRQVHFGPAPTSVTASVAVGILERRRPRQRDRLSQDPHRRGASPVRRRKAVWLLTHSPLRRYRLR